MCKVYRLVFQRGQLFDFKNVNYTNDYLHLVILGLTVQYLLNGLELDINIAVFLGLEVFNCDNSVTVSFQKL